MSIRFVKNSPDNIKQKQGIIKKFMESPQFPVKTIESTTNNDPKTTKQVILCTVHFNTPDLMDALIKSIDMHVPNYHLYIFDNSDKLPYKTTHPNVTILDNTRGQIIDFDKWLQQYPNRFKSGGKVNNWGSAKHCYTIQKCMDLINENFILLDSDVLLKKDISPLFDEHYIYVGQSQTQPKSTIYRVLPYLCFINNKLCKLKNITYFDPNYMHGLHYIKNNKIADSYDTGGAFYQHTRKQHFKEINIDDYIVHYKGGSWSETEQTMHGIKISAQVWLTQNKKYYTRINNNKNKKVIYTCITNNYDTLKPITKKAGWDYICFTDSNIKSDYWQIKPLPKEVETLPANKKQRFVKLNPQLFLPQYDLSIWIDGNVTTNCDIDTFLSNIVINDKTPMAFKKHPVRNCIYQELMACVKLKKETKEKAKLIYHSYIKDKFPEGQGLYETNIIIRKHNNSECIKLMEMWTRELKKGSHRDQLSLNYCIWKLKCQSIITVFSPSYFSQYFTVKPHNKK